MEKNGIIRPSCTLWSSPVVMVLKDGSHHFCVDYRRLNAVTNPDTFPYHMLMTWWTNSAKKDFSTLDHTFGFLPFHWKKMVFVTPKGLQEFRVMLFQQANVPVVFLQLIQKVLAGLNPKNGNEFVTSNIDDYRRLNAVTNPDSFPYHMLMTWWTNSAKKNFSTLDHTFGFLPFQWKKWFS